ncbi:MAG: hypothetical protein SCK28_03330 [Bacillota bacterium]|nr:hypothetical protein [Bacillota bacterium]
MSNLHPKLAISSHGLPMEGDELQQQLSHLANNFNELAVPEQGRYV